MKKKLDISYKSDNELEKKLSNLYPYEFEVDGILVKSMEGLLQSLKTNNINEKEKLWNKYGTGAWRYGQKFNSWKNNQILYWMEKPITRESIKYQNTISHFYDCLFENDEFRKNLKKSLKYNIDHSMGCTDINNTLLTKYEYLENLEKLRIKIKEKRFYNLFNI